MGNSATGPKAHVFYVAGYYDLADRLTATVDVGTNGRATYTHAATAPARSDAALVTSFTYTAAGWPDAVIGENKDRIRLPTLCRCSSSENSASSCYPARTCVPSETRGRPQAFLRGFLGFWSKLGEKRNGIAPDPLFSPPYSLHHARPLVGGGAPSIEQPSDG
jgi:hypothetical protein